MIVGVLGGGQLGRMLALAGLPLGLRFRYLDPDPEAPARHAGEHVCAPLTDPVALRQFARGLALATYEFENVPVETVERLSGLLPAGAGIHPAPAALRVMQDRLEEKRFFERTGVRVPEYCAVGSVADVVRSAAHLRGADSGAPLVLKTRRMGYDGKGQAVLRGGGEPAAEAAEAWSTVSGEHRAAELILERFVTFEREVSLVAVRGRDGALAAYPLVENHHKGGILRLTVAPAPDIEPDLQSSAEAAARRMMEDLGYVGVMAIEFFQCRRPNGHAFLLGNEMAPRVHNSGHWTMEGAECSQFENHLRALLGWPLGSARPRDGTFSAMLNLIGDLPEPSRLLAEPDVHLHLYNKSPRPGRKLGHVTICDSTFGELQGRIERVSRLIDRA